MDFEKHKEELFEQLGVLCFLEELSKKPVKEKKETLERLFSVANEIEKDSNN